MWKARKTCEFSYFPLNMRVFNERPHKPIRNWQKYYPYWSNNFMSLYNNIIKYGYLNATKPLLQDNKETFRFSIHIKIYWNIIKVPAREYWASVQTISKKDFASLKIFETVQHISCTLLRVESNGSKSDNRY